MVIQIPAEYDGRILRSYLKLTLGLSTAVLAKLKNHERGILVNGRRVTVRYILREGDVLELFDRDTAETATEACIKNITKTTAETAKATAKRISAAATCAEAGANALVAGSAIFRAADAQKAIEDIKAAALPYFPQ